MKERVSGEDANSRGMSLQEEWALAQDKQALAAELRALQQQMLDTMPQKLFDLMILEEITYGMRVGRQIMRTVFWSGAFACAALMRNKQVRLLPRSTVKKTLCAGVVRPKDKDVIRAVKTRYPKTGGGARPEVGTPKQPGPLLGIKDHCWQALALVHTWRIARLGERLEVYP